MTATIDRGDGLVQLARSVLADGVEPGEAEHRRRAVQWIDAHGFPTRREEDWRYLPLAPVLDRPLRLPDAEATREASVGALDSVAAGFGGPRLVFVNGHFAPAASRLVGLPEGVTVEGAGGPGGEGGTTGSPPGPAPTTYRHAFEALNDALGATGVVIRVPAGLVVSDPIQLVYLSDPVSDPVGQAVLSSPRSTVVAGPGSSVGLVEHFVGHPDAAGMTNAVTTVRCAEGARVDVDRVQDEAPADFHLSLLDVRQDRGSRFSCRSFALGGSIARHEVRVRLAGEGAEASLEGLFVPRGDQFHDHPVLVEHLAPHTRSRQWYVGVADGGGHGVFNGRIVVSADAHGTDAGQVNRNVLLSDQAEIDTRPRLEIFTDDVRCTHGATVGRLDQSALFYLRSRGIPRPQARAILIHAVVDQIVGHVPLDAFRADVGRRLDRIIDGEGAPW